MQSPWQILNLDPSSATEKDVKAAYARLIKVHRPDTDPEGFQRVREAYEIGLSMLRHRQLESIAEEQHLLAPAESGATTSESAKAESEPPPPTPPGLVEAELAVTRALEAGDQTAAAKAIGALFFACRSFASGAAATQLWQESLHRVTGGRSALAALGVTTPQLIAELESGSAVITHACIGHWDQVHDIASMCQLGDSLLAHADRLHSSEASIVALRLAMEAGFAFQKLGTNLINYAFPHLDREARDRFLPQVEQQIRIGMLFAGFRDDQQMFWHQRFRHTDNDWNWTDPASDAAIEYLVASRPQTWEGYGIIKQLAPAEWFARLEKAMSRRRGGVLGRWKQMRLGESPKPKGWFSRFNQWRGWRFVYSLLLVLYVGTGVIKEIYWPTPNRRSSWPFSNESTSATEPLPRPAPRLVVPKKFQTDYERGRAECIQRAVALRMANSDLDRWFNWLLAMQQNVWPELAKGGATEEAALAGFRKDVRQLIASISSTESEEVSNQVMELALMDGKMDLLIKEQVLLHQLENLPVFVFLPQWERAAKYSPQQAKLVAAAANHLLKNRSGSLALGSDEVQRLRRLELAGSP